ncbi:unnamed protein product [Durusdinium trenchii]|uniref:palmitoyl-CoA hydrolase n=1 Tax=Durusdinium trenchii TaxID=1381693 RepID=A0ABP0S7A4_9DINO
MLQFSRKGLNFPEDLRLSHISKSCQLTMCLAKAILQDYDRWNLDSTDSLEKLVMFHGAAESEREFLLAKHWIESEHPGTWTVLVNLFAGTESFKPLEEQVRGLYAYLLRLQEDFPKQFQGGYNLLCHSQGALVCRAVLQVMENHPVLHFISLAGPQMGVYGTTWLESAQPFLEKSLPIPALPQFIPSSIMSIGAGVLAGNFHTLAYGSLQNSTSLANLWHDPLHEHEYLKGNLGKFLLEKFIFMPETIVFFFNVLMHMDCFKQFFKKYAFVLGQRRNRCRKSKHWNTALGS